MFYVLNKLCIGIGINFKSSIWIPIKFFQICHMDRVAQNLFSHTSMFCLALMSYTHRNRENKLQGSVTPRMMQL